MDYIGTELLLAAIGLDQRSNGQPSQPPQPLRLSIDIRQAARNLEVAPDVFLGAIGVMEMDRVGAPAISGAFDSQLPAQGSTLQLHSLGTRGCGD